MTLKDDTLTRLIDERSPSLKRLEQSLNRVERQIVLEKQRGRKKGNRVKYLVGASILNKMQNDESFRQKITAVLDEETTRTKDRVFLNDYGGFNLFVEQEEEKEKLETA